MKAPKTIIYLVGLYCIISSIIFIGLSVMAMSAFFCLFDFTGDSMIYMIYLLYFRRSSCHKEVNWEALGITGTTPVDRAEMPPETSAVLRTFTFAILYLVLNLGLIVSAFRALSGIPETSKNRHMLFWSYYSFIFIFFIAIIALDFLCCGFYLVEFLLIWYRSNNLMDILEISNQEEMKQFFDQLATKTRTMPSLIFFLVSSKFVLILTLNIAIIYSLFTAVWKVCRDNQKQVFKVATVAKRKEPSPVMSIKSLDSVHERPPFVYEAYARSPKRPQTNAPEPPPRTNSRESQSETFSARLDISIADTKSVKSEATIEEIEIPELNIPRVPYEKSSFQYPSQSDYDQPQSYSHKRNNKTHF